MGIISGFIKTKKYRKLSDNNYQIQSEWTSSDTVEFPDGTTLTNKINAHKHNSLYSPDSKYNVIMQNDGNLVVYKTSDGSVVFATAYALQNNSDCEINGSLTVAATTDYDATKVRNTVFISDDPGVGNPVSYGDGALICVYE